MLLILQSIGVLEASRDLRGHTSKQQKKAEKAAEKVESEYLSTS